MKISLKSLLASLAAVSFALGCSVEPSDPSASEDDIVSEATLKLTSDHRMSVVGKPKAGGGIVIEYALDRLPQCRGNIGGGGPAWNISGFYSEGGGEAKAFEVSVLSEDGKDRVAKAARIPLTKGGDLAVWFQVWSRWGCSAYDSDFGRNFHVDVDGPSSGGGGHAASIVFKADGSIDQQGVLRAGGKVSVRYEQERLPQCRRVQNGAPLWVISGTSSINGAPPKPFEASKVEGADRVPVEASIDLTASGEIAFSFEVTGAGGCHEVDSKGGVNYRFPVE